MEIISEVKTLSKIRPNLWQASDGAVIGFGTLLALASPPRGRRSACPGHYAGGCYFCFSCGNADCPHVATVDGEWLAGRDSALEDYQVPASSGYHTPATVTAPPFTLLEVSAADIQAVNDGNRPDAWKARTREELPSGWPMARVKR